MEYKWLNGKDRKEEEKKRRDRKGAGDGKITQSENLAPNRHEMDEAVVKFGENEAIKESTKWLNKEWKAFQI